MEVRRTLACFARRTVMVRGGRRPSLPMESADRIRLAHPIVAQDLEGYGAAKKRLVGLQHYAHRALSAIGVDLIRPKLSGVRWVCGRTEKTSGYQGVDLVPRPAQVSQRVKVRTQLVRNVRVPGQQLDFRRGRPAVRGIYELVEDLSNEGIASVSLTGSDA